MADHIDDHRRKRLRLERCRNADITISSIAMRQCAGEIENRFSAALNRFKRGTPTLFAARSFYCDFTLGQVQQLIGSGNQILRGCLFLNGKVHCGYAEACSCLDNASFVSDRVGGGKGGMQSPASKTPRSRSVSGRIIRNSSPP